MIKSRIAWLGASFSVTMAIIALWQLVADRKWVSPVFLPGPDRAFGALIDGLMDGDLLVNLIDSLEHMFFGWLLASLMGIAVGSAIGISATARLYLGPTLEFIRPIPASAMVPVAIALFGLTDIMVLAVIAFGAVWPVLLSTVHGFAAVEPRLYEVARLLNLSRTEVTFKIALPNAVPDIIAGLRLNLTVSLILTVVGEMLASQSGLGQWVLFAARSFRAHDLFAGVMLFGAIGYISAQMISLAEQRLLKWRPSGLG